MALPIFITAVLPILFSLAGRDSIVTSVVLIVAWVVFIADLVVHVRLVPDYLRSGQGRFDLGVVILTAPWFLIPGLGDARFLAFARLARLARIAKAGGGRLRRLGEQLGRVGLVAAGILVACSYVAYGAEHSVNRSFASFGDSLWWAIVTITTVGYGDIVPVTTAGRIVAVVLMMTGLGLLGVLAGTIATFFGFGEDRSDPAAQAPRPGDNAAPSNAEDVATQLAALRARVADLDRAIEAVQQRLR